MNFLMGQLNILISALIIGFLPHQEVSDYIAFESLEKDEQMENMIFEQIDHESLYGAVFHIGQGDEVIHSAAGNLEADEPFSIASVTKMFTASVIFQMAEDGLIRMNDTIDMYLRPGEYSGLHVYEGTEYSESITIRQLISQTTGLPAYAENEAEGLTLVEESIDNGASFTFTSKLDSAKEKGARFVNGEGAYYADINYDILGEIIERVSEDTLESQYEQYIFEPLELEDTFLAEADEEDSEVPPVVVNGGERDISPILENMRASGGLISTSDDLMVFVKSFFNGGMFDESFINTDSLQDIQFYFHQYGNGFMNFDVSAEVPVFDMHPLAGHAGVNGSFAFYNRELDLYITGTTNQASDPMLNYELIQQFINLAEE
ncbi:MAG TPA: beta-lactamase family protein [Candidatus Salinicoccus merdavium]|nr:beta-lactamase family protein [Candidatus Salinicoccus merdavium]